MSFFARYKHDKGKAESSEDAVSDSTLPRPSSASTSSSVSSGKGLLKGINRPLPSKVQVCDRREQVPDDVENHATVSSGPLCRCAMRADLRTVNKANGNHGRKFWSCAKPMNEKCNYFEWFDQCRRSVQTQHGRPSPFSEPLNGSKRPRTVDSAVAANINVGLESIQELSIVVCKSVQSKPLLEDLNSIAGLGAVQASQLNSEKYVFPVELISKVQDTASRHSARMTFPFPTSLLSRLERYLDREQHRKPALSEFSGPLEDILPPVMREKLMGFQWDGIKFALRRGGRCLIGDDMGLGKTLQAIAVARIYRKDWPLLIVCPSSLRLSWKDELLQWLHDDIDEDEINVILKGTDCQRALYAINIVSYDLVQKMPSKELRKCNFLIADESHYLKSMDTKRSKFVLPLIRRSHRALLLSGTPALSRPVELFPQINSLEPELFPSFREYTERYCNARMSRWGWDVSGASNLDELYKLICGSCLIRRKKEEVLTQLPSKQRQVIWVETKAAVMKDLRLAQEEFIEARRALESASSEEEAMMCRNAERAANTRLYGLTGDAKLDAIQQYLRDALECTNKLIIFGHHVEILTSINGFLRTKLKVNTILIDGTTPQASRQSLCSDFQNNTKCRAAVLSITAAGVGLTLTAASMVVFAELYWNPGSLLQAEDRAHRIGQRDCVLVKYLLARNTLDESMWSTVKQKLFVVGKSLTGSAAHMAVTGNEGNRTAKGPLDKLLNYSSKDRAADDALSRHYAAIPVSGVNSSNEQDLCDEAGEQLSLSHSDELFPLELPSRTMQERSRSIKSQLFLDPDMSLARSLHTRASQKNGDTDP